MADAAFETIGGQMVAILAAIEAKIQATLDGQNQTTTAELAKIIATMQDNIASAVRQGDITLAQSIQGIINPLELRLIESNQVAQALADRIDQINREIVNSSGETVDLISDNIEKQIAQIRADFDTNLGKFEELVRSLIEVQVIEVEKQFTFFGIRIGDLFDANMKDIEDKIAPILSTVSDIIPGFSGLLEAFLPPFLGPITDVFTSPQGFAKQILDTFITEPLTRRIKESAEQVDPFIKQLEDDPDLGEIIKQFTGGGLISASLVGLLFLGMSAMSLAQEATSTGLSGAFLNLRKKSMRQFTPGILTVAEYQETVRRVHEFQTEAQDDMRDQGFTDERINVLRELASTLMPIADVIDLWRREEIDEQEMLNRIMEHGFNRPEAQHFATLAFAVPGVSDIIRMAVREVFTPEIAEKFGQFEDIPPDFIFWAKVGGLDENWARNFWAAHWELPSLGQGFEMFHRTIDVSPDSDADIITLPSGATTKNVIGANTIDTLMRAQDVMPFWRDKLKQIAFRPLTRVDVRRMHRLGVLSDDKVFRNYLDLGFEPANAQLMLEFTIAFNAAPADNDREDARNLTRTQILTFVEDGLMDEETALDALQQIGFDLNHSNTILESKLLDISRDTKNLQIAVVRERFVNGIIEFNEAVEELAPLSLGDIQVQKILADFEGIKRSRIRTPSRSDMDNFIKADIVSDDEYLVVMRAIGYVDPWPERYLKLAKA